MSVMRPLFTDGVNSFWHFVFGILGTQVPWIIGAYFVYQLWDPFEINLWIDCTEFVIGYILASFTMHSLSLYRLLETLV